MTNRRKGRCEICDSIKNIERAADVDACSTCAFLARSVKNTPDLVVSELKRQHGEKYFPKVIYTEPEPVEPVPSEAENTIKQIIFAYSLEPGANIINFVYNLTVEVAAFKRQAHAAEQTIENLRGLLECGEDESIVEVVAKLQRERKKATDIWFEVLNALGGDPCEADTVVALAEERMAALKKLSSIDEPREDLAKVVWPKFDELYRVLAVPEEKDIVDVAKERMASLVYWREKADELAAEKIVNQLDAPRLEKFVALESTVAGRDSIVLDLALDVLAGKVSGLDADRLSALR